MAKKKETQPKLTREEQIAKAYRSVETFDGANFDAVVPDSRQLFPGDNVEIGNLEDCVVVETSSDFRQVIVEYSRTDNNYGNPITTKGCIGGWSWLDMIKVNNSDEVIAVNRPISVSMISTDLSGLVNNVTRRGMIDNPDYQRGYVWTNEDKVNFLRSVFEDRDLGKFVLVEDKTYSEYRVEVLDGKQRLSALLDFYCSYISYEGKYWHNLSKKDRHSFESRMVQFALIDRNRYSRADLLKLFLEVNVAGVPQTEEHLDYVRALLSKELEKD